MQNLSEFKDKWNKSMVNVFQNLKFQEGQFYLIGFEYEIVQTVAFIRDTDY